MIYIPVIWPLLISTSILSGIALYLRRYRNLPAANAFGISMGLSALWSLIYALNLSTVDFALKFTWLQAQMLVVILISPAFLVFVIEYIGQGGWLTRQNLAWVFLVPAVIALAILTSNYHSLFRYNFRLDTSSSLPIMLSDKGPLFWLYQAYTSGMVLIACGLLIGSYQFRTLYFRNNMLLVAGLVIPSITHLLYLAGITPIRGLELTPFTFVFTGLVYLYALRGSLLFEVIPVARQAVMDNLADLAIVLDLKGNIADFNRAAQQACDLSPAKLGSPSAVLSPPWAGFFQRYTETLSCKDEISLEMDGSARIFDLTISPLLDKRGRSLGRLFLLRNITERKQAEQALRDSETRYHALVETSPDAITLTDRTGKILTCNLQATQLHGFETIEAMLHTNVFDLIASEEHQAVRGKIQQAVCAGGAKAIECTMLKKNGARFAGELSVSVLLDAKGGMNGVIGISRDISARKQIETALRASEERYRLLAENISDVIWILDLESSKFRYVSPSVERLRGYTSEEVLAQDMSAALTPDSLQRLLENLPLALEKFLNGESTQEYDVNQVEQPCKDGSTVWTETTTQFFRNVETGHLEIYGVSRDITDRKRAEDQLRQLSRAVEQSPASIVITDTDANIEYVNPRFSQVTGYSLEEAIGKNPRILKSDRTPTETYRQLWETLSAGKEWRGEFINRRKNGELYNESAIISPVTDPQGNITHYLAVKEDITELKELQKRDLELAALEERQHLARDLHDAVSQTLFSARLTSEMLLRQKENIAPEALWAHIDHLTRLVVSALGEMRILLLELRPEGLLNTELPLLLSHLVDATGARTDAPIHCTVQGHAKLPVDVKIALYRIAQESLNNIIKHARATKIILTLQLDKNGAQLRIEDNGRGFDMQHPNGGQLGLGIMRERAEEIGASLEVASQPEKGTTVTCTWKE
jgi:PAS domain S-box-containing protein